MSRTLVLRCKARGANLKLIWKRTEDVEHVPCIVRIDNVDLVVSAETSFGAAIAPGVTNPISMGLANSGKPQDGPLAGLADRGPS